jgi:tetratricopeptide (TPR) repeat protein
MENGEVAITDDELRSRLQAVKSGDPALALEFFKDFTYHRDLHQAHDYREAYHKTLSLLQKLKMLDPIAYQRIHKGATFYWAAICAYLIHNYEQAVYLFDAAVLEDLKNDATSVTPAKLFLTLNGNDPKQAAREMTQIAEGKLIDFIKLYDTKVGAQQISMNDIREKFLRRVIQDRSDWRTQATALISFLLEWNYLYILQEIRPEDGTWEPFLTNLFKGCVLFESLLKANPTVLIPERDLGGILNANAQVRHRLGINRSIVTSNVVFSDLVQHLPASTDDMQTEIEFVARMRNAIGHNIGWNTRITPSAYIRMVTEIAVVCLHVISNLY